MYKDIKHSTCFGENSMAKMLGKDILSCCKDWCSTTGGTAAPPPPSP